MNKQEQWLVMYMTLHVNHHQCQSIVDKYTNTKGNLFLIPMLLTQEEKNTRMKSSVRSFLLIIFLSSSIWKVHIEFLN